MLKKKIILLPIDYQLNTMGISEKTIDELKNNLNIIINAADSSEFEMRLDLQTDINVGAPLMLMKLAQKCLKFEIFCHVSTTFALSDKTGFIDEKTF